jgi:hypothetical protein
LYATKPSLYSEDDDDYIAQLVQSHEIGVRAASITDVKLLMSNVPERHAIVFRVSDLLFINPFFDLDIKVDVDEDFYKKLYRDFNQLLECELEIDPSCIHYHRREGSSGVHVVVTGYRLSPAQLIQWTLIMRTSKFFKTNYEVVKVDTPTMYGIPGFVKPGQEDCYRKIKTREKEMSVFPKNGDKPLLINLSSLKATLSYTSLPIRDPDITFKSLDIKLFPLLTSDDIVPWACNVIGNEFGIAGKFVQEYICKSAGDFRSCVFELYLIHDPDSAEVEFSKLCKKFLWQPPKEILMYKGYLLDLVTCIETIGEYIDVDDLLDLASQKTDSSLLFYDASHNTLLPVSLSISLWDTDDSRKRRKNDYNYFLNIISRCQNYLEMRGIQFRKEYIIQYIMWAEYRFKHLIYRLYELEFGSNERCSILFENLCDTLKWTFKTYHFGKQFNLDLTIREILYNILVMNSTSCQGADLCYALVDQTISFNRHFIDTILNTYSTGYTAKDYIEVGNKADQLFNVLSLIFHIWPIISHQSDKDRQIFVNGRVYNTKKGVIRSVLAEIFQFYRPMFPPFDLQSTEWASLEKYSAVFDKIFQNSVPCILVTSDGWALHDGDIFYNTYSLVSSGAVLKLDYRTIKQLRKCKSMFTEEQVKNLDGSMLCPGFDMLYALQYIYGIQNYNWHETLKLIKFLRDSVNFRANRSITIFYGVRGMNGKSYLVSLLAQILGYYFKPIGTSYFKDTTKNHHTDIRDAGPRAVAFVDEFNIFGENLIEENIKRLTGEMEFTIRAIKEGEEPITFRGGLIVTTNTLTKCKNSAMILRSFIFVFSNTVIVKRSSKQLDISYRATKGGTIVMAEERGLDVDYRNRLVRGLIKLLFSDIELFSDNNGDINWRDCENTQQIIDAL